jgi:hypothetical protein
MRVRGAIDEPWRMNGERHAKHDAGGEPEQRGADEPLDEPFHSG